MTPHDPYAAVKDELISSQSRSPKSAKRVVTKYEIIRRGRNIKVIVEVIISALRL
jgi:hypothetical protein